VKKNFKIGENVFMTAGNNVMEARVERPQYGRYVVAYKGSGYEAEGRICVSETRLFHSYDEAMANIRKVPAVEPVLKAVTQAVLHRAASYRVDEPGDGWARR
jgi:hypothetical protein